MPGERVGVVWVPNGNTSFSVLIELLMVAFTTYVSDQSCASGVLVQREWMSR
jgi:hypothetical protein